MPIISLLLLTVSSIQIDGNFTDWSEGQTTSQDAQYLYKRMQLDPKVCLQQLPTELTIELGGYDLLFSPNDRGYGVSCFQNGKSISPYDIGLVFAPTTASPEFEVRINKPNTSTPTTPFDIKSTSEDSVRVVSWNVQFGNLLDEVDIGSRVLQALQPDILLLQELDGDDTPDILIRFLDTHLGGDWNVYMSAVPDVPNVERHRQLRSAIATRLPSTKLVVKHTPSKFTWANIELKGQTFTFTSLHLRCCGGPDSEAEEQRQHEAHLIRNALDTLKTDGIVLAGDWNLVGTSVPLDIVKSNDLTVVSAYQPDGLLTATWSDTTSPFTPGRLDWMLVSKAAVDIDRGFVLDTSDLNSETLAKYNLRSDDTEKLSDHLPLVADVRIKSP